MRLDEAPMPLAPLVVTATLPFNLPVFCSALVCVR
jgi:hypothetical protein